jgi:hypothetical protein
VIDANRTPSAVGYARDKDIRNNFDFVVAVRGGCTLWQYDPTIVCRTVEWTLKFDPEESKGFDSAFRPLNRFPNNPPGPDIGSVLVQPLIQLNVDRSESTAVRNLGDMPREERNQNGMIPFCIALPANNSAGDSNGHALGSRSPAECTSGNSPTCGL